MTASFSSEAKSEICRVYPQKHCCALSECFGILLFCSSCGYDGIRIVTENSDFAAMLPKLFKKAFSLNFDILPDLESGGKMVFLINNPEKLKIIMNSYGFEISDTVSLHVNLSVIEDECCKSAFLRGAFLAGGSVTDPTKGYHMELATTHQAVARETFALMQDVLGFYAKIAQRSGGQVLYLKQSDLISDFLTFLGAPIAAMGIIEARLEKELNNKVNRRCNCDDANISKVVEAAHEQITAISILKKAGLFDSLPAKLLQAANARLENPESSLTELAGLMEPPISKPAMNHRLKKLVEMSREVLQ